jgi:hypothetical protein
MFGLVSAVLGILAALGKMVWGLFSAERQLKHIEVQDAHFAGQAEAEQQRVEDAYRQIEQQTPPPDVTEDLNRRFGG